MATSQKKNTWVLWVVIAILALALLLPLIVKVGGSYYRWGFDKGTEEMVSSCPECPVENETIIVYRDTVPSVEEDKSPVTDDYVCDAVKVGGPVETAGQCSFCTVNYEKPGDVFVAGKEPIQYEAGAWVFQYNSTEDIDEYKGCINGQDMVTDPSLGYNIVWH